MSFSCQRKELHTLVRRLAGIADKKSSMPMLRNILIRANLTGVVLAATDLNVYCVCDAPGWTIHSRGSMTVGAKALADVVAKLPDGEITVTATMRGVVIKQGAAEITLEGIPARDYPKLPAVLPDDPCLPFTAISATALKAALGAVSYAVCKDETRFHLNGVRVEFDGVTLRTVATDGHRLTKYQALCDRRGDWKTDGLIVPAKAVKEIGKLLGKGECEIALLGTHMLAVRQGGTTLVVKTIDAQFPPYEQVIPKDYQRLCTVDRKALIGALGRAKLVCTQTRGCKLELGDDTLAIASDNPDTGETRETLPAECKPKADKFVIGLNPNYALDGLEALDCERVTLSFDHKRGKNGLPELSPILIRSAEDAAFHRVEDATIVCVVMPMRI